MNVFHTQLEKMNPDFDQQTGPQLNGTPHGDSVEAPVDRVQPAYLNDDSEPVDLTGVPPVTIPKVFRSSSFCRDAFFFLHTSVL